MFIATFGIKIEQQFMARVAIKVSGLFVPLTIHTMDCLYHSLVPGVMVCPQTIIVMHNKVLK